MKNTLIAGVTIAMAIAATNAAADFASVSVSSHPQSGEYSYAGSSSTKFKNSIMTISAYAQDNCAPKLNFLVYGEEPSTLGSMETRVKIRVDKGTIWTGDATMVNDTFRGDDGTLYYRQSYTTGISGEALSDFVTGNRLIFRDVDGDLDTDFFSLSGSSRALSKVVSTCQKMAEDEWGDTGNAWNERTSSDDDAWDL